ncbi:MAG: hypothetical protein IJC04_08790 [Oscillospiraceae bacterium]|nr:hypothetical protein [Oscillospiraceae bacterium]
MSRGNFEWMFSKCFKTVMSFMYFLSLMAMMVSRYSEGLSDFTIGFLHGFQLTAQVLWIIFAIICLYNKQSPFVIKEERNK